MRVFFVFFTAWIQSFTEICCLRSDAFGFDLLNIFFPATSLPGQRWKKWQHWVQMKEQSCVWCMFSRIRRPKFLKWLMLNVYKKIIIIKQLITKHSGLCWWCCAIDRIYSIMILPIIDFKLTNHWSNHTMGFYSNFLLSYLYTAKPRNNAGFFFLAATELQCAAHNSLWCVINRNPKI